MPRQVSITRDMVDKAVFDLIRSQGMEALTARSIAERIGCSTQPIYNIYPNLGALRDEAVRIASNYADNLIFGYDRTNIPFLNAGLGYIRFAATEKVLFRVFTIENYLGEPVLVPMKDARLYAMMEEILGDALSPPRRREAFRNTMIFASGLALMAYSGQLGMNERLVAERLADVFMQFTGIDYKGEIFK